MENRKWRKSTFALSLFLFSIFHFQFFLSSSAADLGNSGDSSPSIVTIQSVYLGGGGQWRRIISPDKRVDLSVEEPSVVFFNNAGRVPVGEYQNFKVEFYRDGQKPQMLTLVRPLDQPVQIQKGSFVRVSFNLDKTHSFDVLGAKLTADEDEREFLVQDLKIEQNIHSEEKNHGSS